MKPTDFVLDPGSSALVVSFEDGFRLTLAPGGTLAEPVGIRHAELQTANGRLIRYQGASTPPNNGDCRITQFSSGLNSSILARYWRSAIVRTAEPTPNAEPRNANGARDPATIIRILQEPAGQVHLRHLELGRCG